MVNNSAKVLSLVLAAALALVLFAGASPSTSDGATDHVFDSPLVWATPITLYDGDTLFIKESAGEPTSPYNISIAPNANVSITGEGNPIKGVKITESYMDTAAHSVAIKDLNINGWGSEGYVNYMGVISIFGANSISGGSDIGIKSNAGDLTLKGDGNLLASSTGRAGISAADLNLMEKVSLNVSGAATALACDLSGGTITMDPGTTFVMTKMGATPESHPFAMSADGSKWLISGGASFVASTPASNPATISFAAGGTTGSVILASPPGISGPASEVKNVGYAAFTTAAFTVTGSPTPTVTMTTSEPKITWNSGTMKLSIAAGLPAGEYTAVLTASNGFIPAMTLTFKLTVVAATVTSVTVDPATVNVQKGTTQAFTANVEGTGLFTDGVTWSVSGQEDTATSINSTTGVLTVAAGETSKTITVKATSTFDTTKSGTATVTVTAEEPGGGGSNTILWVAVVLAIAVFIAVLVIFFFKKPAP